MKKSFLPGFLLSCLFFIFFQLCITVPDEEITPEDIEEDFSAEEESSIIFNPFKIKSKP